MYYSIILAFIKTYDLEYCLFFILKNVLCNMYPKWYN